MSQAIHATPIRLGGAMGKKFGRLHHFHLDSGSTSEALCALMSQIKGLREYWLNAHKQGIEFAVFTGGRNLPAEHFALPSRGEIRIVPVLKGAKNGGILQIVAGVVLVIAGGLVSGLSYGWAAPVGSAMIQLGWGMIVGGIVQLLTPLPHGKSAKDSPANTPNYSFNGPINTQAQGNPVPLAYGEVHCGSAVISAGIDVIDTAYHAQRGGNPKLGDMGGGDWSGRGVTPYIRSIAE